MGRVLLILFSILTLAFVAAGAVHTSGTAPASTPEGAVQAMFTNVQGHNWQGAYSYVSPASNVDLPTFTRDLTGRDGSLRTYSSLESVTAHALNESANDAMVRTELKYSTAVGAFYDTRDLKVVKDSGAWKVLWVAEKVPVVPPQVIPVNYLRWDIVWRGVGDDWGSQNVENPHIRILSMNPTEQNGNVTFWVKLRMKTPFRHSSQWAQRWWARTGRTFPRKPALTKRLTSCCRRRFHRIALTFPHVKTG